MRRSVALVLTAGSVVQFGAAFAVSLFDRVGPGGIVFLRLAFAAAILVAIYRPSLRGRDPRPVIAFGLVLGAMNWSFYESLHRIPIGAAVTIEFLGPLSVAVWGSRRPVDLVWVALAAAGVLILADPFGGGGGLNAAGAGLALFAGVCWATYIVLSARIGRDWHGASGLAFALVFGALLTLPAGIVQGGTDLLSPGVLAAGLTVALASSVIPYSLEMEALRTLPKGVFGVMMSLEPGIAALAGLLLLGQDLSALDVVAIACVVVASAGATASVKSWTPSPSATAA